MCDPDVPGTGAADKPALTRRRLLANSARLAAVGTFAAAAATGLTLGTPAAVGREGRTRVFLLGSHGGQQRTELTGAGIRSGPSALITVDGVGYLMDAGVGALLRLSEAGFDATVVRHVFMTHHHQDHNADLGNMIGFTWTSGRQGDPDRRLGVWGPRGTRAYVRGYKAATAINIRDQEGPLAQKPALDDYLHEHEFSTKGQIRTAGARIMRDARVTVRAIRVNHGSVPTVGYRFMTPDLDVVFSGDRGPGKPDHFVDFARGTDILFHEIIDLDIVVPVLQALPDAEPLIEHLQREHSAPEVVGNTASAATVGRLVLYHLVPGTPLLADEHWRELVAPYYAGEVVVGRDLLVI